MLLIYRKIKEVVNKDYSHTPSLQYIDLYFFSIYFILRLCNISRTQSYTLKA